MCPPGSVILGAILNQNFAVPLLRFCERYCSRILSSVSYYVSIYIMSLYFAVFFVHHGPLLAIFFVVALIMVILLVTASASNPHLFLIVVFCIVSASFAWVLSGPALALTAEHMGVKKNANMLKSVAIFAQDFEVLEIVHRGHVLTPELVRHGSSSGRRRSCRY